MNIKYLDQKHKLSLNNAWLSGFTDAESCFTSSVLTSKKNR
jgi:hypothetical protein